RDGSARGHTRVRYRMSTCSIQAGAPSPPGSARAITEPCGATLVGSARPPTRRFAPLIATEWRRRALGALSGKRLREIADQVGAILDPAGDADQRIGDAHRRAARGAHLPEDRVRHRN